MLDKLFFEKLRANLTEAFWFIKTNKVRTFLTALGIIFGVASVIAMLAIGNGAQQEILSQLRLVGVNNIIVTPIVETKQATTDDAPDKKSKLKTTRFSKGLDLSDAMSIQKHIPGVKSVSAETIMDTYMIKNGIQNSVKLVGVLPSYFETSNLPLEKGTLFSDYQKQNALPVCIIGKKVEESLFRGKNPLGKYIKVKDVWLEVIGVIEDRFISEKSQKNLGIRDFNKDVYVPLNTFLVRYQDRKNLTATGGRSSGLNVVAFGGGVFVRSGGNKKNKPTRGNYHQVDRVVVQVSDSKALTATAEVLNRMLKRRHNDVVDFEITIPIQLLKQQQKTKQIFNIVLSIIAGISLLIGGIGIMNIMLASVLERTKEIGIIRAIGAREEDVILQFLSEAILISFGGGVIGVLLGILSAYIIEITSGIKTILSFSSILLSFVIAVAVGLIFGIFPAKAAARKKPIEALRTE